MSINELEKRVTELKELQRMAEDLNAEITAIQDTIKAEMTERNADEITAGAFKIRWKPIIGHRLDSKAFKADYADLYARYSVETMTRRFSIA